MSPGPSEADLENLAAELVRLAATPQPTADPAVVARVLERVAAARPEPLPAMIDNYRIIRELGCGGMGVVYLAHDERLSRRVAIKVIHPGWATEAEFRERFRREGEALAALRAENVVRIYGAGESGGGLYLVMEYLEGVSLEDGLQAGLVKVSAADVLWVAEDVLSGLIAVHNAGYTHRDVKPGNLRIHRGRVKILDFGIATNNGAGTAVAGTFDYMAQEQRTGCAEPRSDLYSLGAVLYRMVTGHAPQPGDTFARDLALLRLPELERFIVRLLAQTPADRPDANAALVEVRAIRDRIPPPDAEPRKDRRRWIWLTIGLAASLGIVIAGWLLDHAAAESRRTTERANADRRAAERAALIEEIRKTDQSLDQGVIDLKAASAALDKAAAAADPANSDPKARAEATRQFGEAMSKLNTTRDEVERSRGRRATLLDQLERLDGR